MDIRIPNILYHDRVLFGLFQNAFKVVSVARNRELLLLPPFNVSPIDINDVAGVESYNGSGDSEEMRLSPDVVLGKHLVPVSQMVSKPKTGNATISFQSRSFTQYHFLMMHQRTEIRLNRRRPGPSSVQVKSVIVLMMVPSVE